MACAPELEPLEFQACFAAEFLHSIREFAPLRIEISPKLIHNPSEPGRTNAMQQDYFSCPFSNFLAI
eukprot:scaffold63_cov306-Pinguiococcus_pyrenoidosus.AAC.63